MPMVINRVVLGVSVYAVALLLVAIPVHSHGQDKDKSTTEAASVGHAQKDTDCGPYMADLQRQIKRAWFPPKGDETKRVTVLFKIAHDGKLSHLKIDHSSGVASADQAALKAVENAAPFSSLPDGAPDDVDVEFTFDYNVHVGKDQHSNLLHTPHCISATVATLSRWVECNV